jgi:stress-induced morphogen
VVLNAGMVKDLLAEDIKAMHGLQIKTFVD